MSNITQKTALEWFQELPKEICDKAIANTKKEDLKNRYTAGSAALTLSFAWSNTPEGVDYWNLVCKDFEAKERQCGPNESIDYCIEKYPQMMAEFQAITLKMLETFAAKQRNYGPGNISVGTNLETSEERKLALTGLWFRKTDKISRIKQMVLLGEPDTVGESIEDTYLDLAVYSVISLLVNRSKWGK